MNSKSFLNHPKLQGKHALLSPSSPTWLNYDEDKLRSFYANYKAKLKGTELHDLACKLITNRIRLPKTKETFNMYVNDAIGFRMTPEQILYFSDNCFGTADAICCRGKKLRIHDLKTGTTPAKMEQLVVYAALYFLEYHEKPSKYETELRIYQSNDILIFKPTAEDLLPVMDKIKESDAVINEMKLQEV